MKLLAFLTLQSYLLLGFVTFGYGEVINSNQDYWVEVRDEEINTTFGYMYWGPLNYIPVNRIINISEIIEYKYNDYSQEKEEDRKKDLNYYLFWVEVNSKDSRLFFHYKTKESAEKDREELMYLWRKYEEKRE